MERILRENNMKVKGGTIVDVTIIDAPHSVRNSKQERDPEMHSTRKGNNRFFGMRAHIGGDPVHGFVHTVVCTLANETECKAAPQLLREDDKRLRGCGIYKDGALCD